MSEVITHAPGTVYWVELNTTDAGAARTFYQSLFGWDATEVQTPQGTPYTMLQKDGRDAGGLQDLPDEQRAQGVPPHWMLFTCVEAADAAAEQARAQGGSVVAGPYDAADIGRMATLRDPEGATFSVWEPKGYAGLGLKDAPGALCWTELSTRDAESATAFYGTLFGWDARTEQMPEGNYTMFSVGDADLGGMVQMDEEWGDMPAAWMPYFGIADLEAALQEVPTLGGEVAMGPVEVEDVGRFAVVQDPQGAFLSIIQLDAFG